MAKKTLAISAIFGLITLVLVAFVIYPLFKGIKKNSHGLCTAKKDLILYQDKINNFERVKESYESWEKELKKIERLFVDPEIPIEIIKFWEKLALDSEVSIDISLISVKTAEAGAWGSINFQLTLAGPFPNFLKFFEKLETSPYLIEIKNLTINSKESGVSATLLTKVFTQQK